MEKNSSSPAKKLRNYLYEFLESDPVQDELSELRKRYDIPANGIPFGEKEMGDIKRDSIIYFPDGFIKSKSMIGRVSGDLNHLTEKFPLKNLGIQSLIRVYFFHNVIPEALLKTAVDEENLCKIVDFNEDMLEECISDSSLKKIYLQHVQKENYYFPIALKINPRASKRDVLKFIEKNWVTIHRKLSKYDDRYGKLGKVKSKNPLITKRNRLILKHNDKSYSEIRKILKDNGIPMELIDRVDEGSVGKIRSIDRQRRKEV